MPTIDKKLSKLLKLNDEVNAQLIYTPNRYETLEELFEFLESGEENKFLYFTYQSINKLFNNFLFEIDCLSAKSLSERQKIEFKERIIHNIKNIRDELLRQIKYSFTAPKSDEYIQSIKNNINERIKNFINLNIDNILSRLFSGEILSIQNEDFENRFKQLEALIDYRENYAQQARACWTPKILFDKENSSNIADKIDTFVTGIYIDRIKSTVGQCGEHVALSLVKILNERLLDVEDTIEIIRSDYINNDAFEDNHVCLAINRDPNSDLGDISTWGKDAIFYDSWKKTAFKARDYLSHRFINFDGSIKWKSIKITYEDYLFFRSLRRNDLFLTITQHDKRESLVSSLINEYQLISLDDESFATSKKIINQLLEEVRPKNFSIPIQIFLTSQGSELITIIPGFKEPAIAIDPRFANYLENQDDVEELKFALAQTLCFIKTHGVGVENKISAIDQYEIDVMALKTCKNGEAALNFLRHQALLKNDLSQDELPLNLLNISQLGYHDVIPASYEQRIKNIMTFFAKEPLFSQNKNSSPFHTNIIHQELKTHSRKYFFKEQLEKCTSTLEKIHCLNKNLISLKENELVPYEFTLLPSIRVREFCYWINNLKINWDNQDEVHAVDELIDAAFDLRVPGFDRIYTAFMGKKFVSYYKLSGGSNYKPLGKFKTCQTAILDFTQSTDLAQAKQSASRFLQCYQEIKNHFMAVYVLVAGELHLKRYQKKHPEEIPTGKNRFFGSYIGSKINWLFTKQDTFCIDDFLAFVERDDSGVIAEALWVLGLNTHPLIVDQLSKKVIEAPLRKEDRSYINVQLPEDLCQYHKKEYDYEKFIIKYQSNKHVLQTKMFDSALSFEEKFKQFYHANFNALRYPCDQGINADEKININSNNEAVHFLLKKFTEIALFGSEAEKKVVKSFFLGREDRSDLSFLISPYGDLNYGKLSFNSLYYQFCYYQTYDSQFFKLFTDDELIKLIQKIHGCNVPVELLLKVFKLPQEEGTLDCLEVLMPKINEYNLWLFNVPILDEHLKKDGPYELFSSEGVRFLKLILQDKFYKQNDLLKKLKWTEPTIEQLAKINIQDLILIYRTYENHFLFLSFKQQQSFGKFIFNLIANLDSQEEQLNALENLLSCEGFLSHPLGDIYLRNQVINLWVHLIAAQCGLDDGSQEYLNKIKPIILRIKEKVAKRDMESLFSKLADALDTQAAVSEYIGVLLTPEKYLHRAADVKNTKSHFAIATLAATTTYLGSDDETKLQTLSFISNPINKTTLSAFADHLIQKNKTQDLLGMWWGRDISHSMSSEAELKRRTMSTLQALYDSFWDCHLTERAILVDYLTIPADQVKTPEQINAAYEKTLTYAANKLFPHADQKNSDDEFAFEFLKSYLNTADKYMRSILLAGLIVVSNEIANDAQQISIGKKIALLCEHMGPAYVKLAQAIHSHPKTPEHIRKDLAHIKGRANPPTRWDLWRLLLEVLPDEDIAQIKHVGKLLGSASYKLALEVELKDGRKLVLLLLRENAQEQAKEGFDHLKLAINTCEHNKLKPIRKTLVNMLAEAEELSAAEMDHHISDEQDKIADGLYKVDMSVTFNHDPYTVFMRPATTLSSGRGYRFVERIYGEEFNHLPDQTPKQKQTKKIIAAAVVTVELLNILQGKHFDSDRHGNQLRALIDHESKTIHLGLYDFGEMSLEPPAEVELKQFAQVLDHLLTPSVLRNQFSVKFEMELSKAIYQAVSENQPIHYLTRIRKSMLALHDFQQYLSDAETFDIILNILKNDEKDIHPALQEVLNKHSLFLSMMKTSRSLYKNIASLFNKQKVEDAIQEENVNLYQAQI